MLAVVVALLAVLFRNWHEEPSVVTAGKRQNGAIIFTSTRSGNTEIHAVDPDGSPPRTLVEKNTATDGGGLFYSRPSWQPLP